MLLIRQHNCTPSQNQTVLLFSILLSAITYSSFGGDGRMVVTLANPVNLLQIVPQVKDAIAVLAMIGFDIIIGLIKAFSTHSYTSEIMREGLFHKLGELLCFIFGVVCDLTLPNMGVILPVSITGAVAAYLVFMEIGSIIENIGVMNPKLAKYLSMIFAKVEHPDEEVKDADE